MKLDERPAGKEHRVQSSLVPIGGRLPYYLEAPTPKLLDLLVNIFPNSTVQRSEYRKKINKFIYVRTKPSFYLELNEHLHLAYADQRDGPRTQHWWRLFFDEQYKTIVESATKGTTLTIAGKTPASNDNQPSPNNDYSKEWNGMYFRSETEVCIVQELYNQGVLFFANARGNVNTDSSPISAKNATGRLEIDFLVFHKGKCISLEIDGEHHNHNGQITRDYSRDRLLLKEDIPTARFSATECYNQTLAVVEEFLEMFNLNKKNSIQEF